MEKSYKTKYIEALEEMGLSKQEQKRVFEIANSNPVFIFLMGKDLKETVKDKDLLLSGWRIIYGITMDYVKRKSRTNFDYYQEIFARDAMTGGIMTRYGDLDRINIEPGAILLNNSTVSQALDLFDEERVSYRKFESSVEKTKFRQEAFACLMQFMESFVLHERVYVLDLPLHSMLSKFAPQETIEAFGFVPKSTEIEKELHSLKTKDSVKVILFGPTEVAYQILTASSLGLPYKPHPIRGLESQYEIQKAQDNYYTGFAERSLEKIGGIASEEIREMNRWLGEARYCIELPLISNYILEKKGWSKNNIFDIALEVRNSKEAKAFRSVCAEFDTAARLGDDGTLFRLKADIEQLASELKNRYNTQPMELTVQFPWGVALNPLELWKKVQRKRKRYLLFLENVYQASVKSEGLRKAFYKEFG